MFSFLFKKVLRFRLSALPARQSWSFQSASFNRMRKKKKKKKKEALDAKIGVDAVENELENEK